MTAGLPALLVGLFAVPVAFLWLGHGWRRRTPRQRAAFWGGLAGYLVASLAVMLAGMIPPSEWSAADTVRGALGWWSLLVAPALGAAVAVLAAKSRRD